MTIIGDPLAMPGSRRKGAEGDIGRDQWGRYILPLPGREHDDPLSWPSWTRVSTLAKTQDDTYSLSAWQAAMAVRGICLRQSLYLAACTTDYDKAKDAFNKIVADAQHTAGANERRDLGTALHGLFEVNDRAGEAAADRVCPDLFRDDLTAYRQLLRDHNIRYLPECIERTGVVPDLDADDSARRPVGGTAGTMDRAGWLDDPTVPNSRPFIIDVKTGGSLRYLDLHCQVQLGLYAAMRHLWNRQTMQYEPAPFDGFHQARGYILHCPAREPENYRAYPIDISRGAELARRAAEIRRDRKVRAIGAALPRPTTQASPAIVSNASPSLSAGIGHGDVAVSGTPEADRLIGQALAAFPNLDLPPGIEGPLDQADLADMNVPQQHYGQPDTNGATAPATRQRAERRKRCPGCNELIKRSMAMCVECASKPPAAPVSALAAAVESEDRAAGRMCPQCDERPGVGVAGTLCAACGLAAALAPLKCPQCGQPGGPGGTPCLACSTDPLTSWRKRIDQAKVRADLSTIWRAATTELGNWPDELQQYAQAHAARGYLPA